MQDKRTNKRIIYRRLIIWIASVLIIFLISRYLLNQIRIHRFNNVVSEYMQIDNYQDAKDLFERDLKNKELKYFTYGMYYDKSFYKIIKKEYNLEIFHMGCINEGRLSLYNYYVEKEVIKDIYHETTFIDTADSIWTCFVRALETRQIDYLILNSFDTIVCSELDIQNQSKDEQYQSKFVFENYLDKLMHLNDLSTRERSTYIVDDKIIVNYIINSKAAEDGGYNLIFTFKKKENKYFFYGMTMT